MQRACLDSLHSYVYCKTEIPKYSSITINVNLCLQKTRFKENEGICIVKEVTLVL